MWLLLWSWEDVWAGVARWSMTWYPAFLISQISMKCVLSSWRRGDKRLEEARQPIGFIHFCLLSTDREGPPLSFPHCSAPALSSFPPLLPAPFFPSLSVPSCLLLTSFLLCSSFIFLFSSLPLIRCCSPSLFVFSSSLLVFVDLRLHIFFLNKLKASFHAVSFFTDKIKLLNYKEAFSLFKSELFSGQMWKQWTITEYLLLPQQVGKSVPAEGGRRPHASQLCHCHWRH